MLRDVSATIDEGEYVGLIGKNGSGKTTLMKVILGLVKPAAGTVRVFGEPVSRSTLARVGYTPQMHRIPHEFPATVGDVVGMGLYKRKGFQHRLDAHDQESIQLALHKVRMEEFLNRPVGHLSGGEQQKVLVAQALVNEPRLLLLDEPTSALDFVMVQDLLELVGELNRKYGLTLVVIQHNLEMLRPHCSRLLMLRRAIMYDGDPRAPAADEMLRDVFHA